MVSFAGRQPQKLERNFIFFRGFRRNVLTSEVGEKWFENGLREPARPCCFPVLRLRFLRSTRLSIVWFLYSICMETTKNVIQIFVFVHFGAMCAAGFAANAVQNHGFVCRETIKSWNETLHFLEDSDATFWHRRWGKSCMAFVSRPGHAVFPFWGLVSWGPRGFLLWFLSHLHGNHQKCDPDFSSFWSDVRRWLCRKCGPKPWFVCRETTKSWNETLYFSKDSDATFWHRRWGKSGWKMAFVSRPGHAVFPFWGLVSWGPRGFLVWFLQHLHGNHPECDPDIRFPFWSDVRRWLCRKCGPKPWFRLQGNHQKLERKRNLTFFRGFRRNVLTSEVGEKWLENGLREPARPCCFPVLRPRFLRSTRLSNPPTPASARGSAPWEGL